MLIILGLLLVTLVTAATGYFVAQEFSYVAVDRGRLRREADAGDQAAARALAVTERLSFVLSGAQLGITVTALIVGYVAEPFLGEGLAGLLGLTGIPAAVSLPLSIALALLVATVVQMVLGELAPKNLAIARAETLAKALSRSTLLYLKIFGPVIRVFDKAAGALLRRVGIEPIEELPEGATEADLGQIIAGSRADGQLDAELFALLHRGLDFRGRTAGEAMVPRVDVHTLAATATAADAVALLDTGRSRFPVRGPVADSHPGAGSVLPAGFDRRADSVLPAGFAPRAGSVLPAGFDSRTGSVLPAGLDPGAGSVLPAGFGSLAGYDEIIGVIGIADVLTVPPGERATTMVTAAMSEPVFVPSSLRLPAVLDRLRAGHRQLACVVDEYGGFAGIITLEDIAEELVGQIRDEDDLSEPVPVRDSDGSWLVPARWRIDEITEATGVTLPEGDDYDTVSGLVMARLGRVPEVGDSVAVDGFSVRVVTVDRHVAQTVRLSR